MAERKLLVRQEFGAPDTPQEQEFVSRVDETVDCLGEKGGRPGHQGCRQFGPGDQEVAEEGGPDDER
jgi:hypothetical protein